MKYYPSTQYSYDSVGTFRDLGLIHFSSSDISLSASETSRSCTLESKLPCLVSGCYDVSQKCDGVTDCLEDGIDEAACRDDAAEALEQRQKFRLSR